MQTIETRLANVDAAIKRWRPKLTRASNEMTRLLKKRERLIKERLKAFPNIGRAVSDHFDKMVGPKDYDAIEAKAAEVVGGPEPAMVETLKTIATVDDIPEFLRRGMAAQKAVDTEIAKAVEKMATTTVPKVTPMQLAKMRKADERRRGPVSKDAKQSPIIKKALAEKKRLEALAKRK